MSSSFMEPVSIPGCLAIKTGSLLMLVLHQRASDMSLAKSVSQVVIQVDSCCSRLKGMVPNVQQ
eukprot:scaffold62861_cov15-Tisochrysis_lutea.AAC.1